MAAGSPDSIRKVARRGSKLLLDQLASTQLAIERFNIYKAEAEACGRAPDPSPVVEPTADASKVAVRRQQRDRRDDGDPRSGPELGAQQRGHQQHSQRHHRGAGDRPRLPQGVLEQRRDGPAHG